MQLHASYMGIYRDIAKSKINHLTGKIRNAAKKALEKLSHPLIRRTTKVVYTHTHTHTSVKTVNIYELEYFSFPLLFLFVYFFIEHHNIFTVR